MTNNAVRKKIVTMSEKPAKGNKLVVISGRNAVPAAEKANGGSDPGSWTVTQMRLARIQELQSRLAFDRKQLAQEWQTLRQEMIGGATVEVGPIRAWLKSSLRYVQVRGSRKRQARTYTTLIVR